MKKKQTIKCDVCDCKFNDDENCLCNLESINVSSCNNENCTCKKETLCDSFKEKE